MEDRILENERLLMEQIRELDTEELQIEEVGDDDDDGEDEYDPRAVGRGDGGAGPSGGFTFDTCLASLHTYLGEVDDTHGRRTLLDGGAILNLPMFYLEGVVLFPEATLPLRVIQPRFIAAVEKAMNQVDTPCTIGVVRVKRASYAESINFATVGTTAEIRQYRRLNDGTLNIVARGQQRFYLRRRWIDVEGAPCAEVQIVEEDSPMRTPRDAFAQLAAVSNNSIRGLSRISPPTASPSKWQGSGDPESDWECMSAASTLSDYSSIDLRAAADSPDGCERFDVSSSSDEDIMHGQGRRLWRSRSNRLEGSDQSSKRGNLLEEDRLQSHLAEESSLMRSPKRPKGAEKSRADLLLNKPKRLYNAPMSFWPRWVYQMYDSYSLAEKAADLWRRIIRIPTLDDFITKPDLLSFYIASKLPTSDCARQELLEINGISYRLQREIQLLKHLDLIRCKNCQSVIAKRSDMVVMSSDGPLNAYVNPDGYVHEVITVHNASGLVLRSPPVKEHSWFPGYAWTITNCAVCESNMGWLFTATERNLRPKSFWGIRSSQVEE